MQRLEWIVKYKPEFRAANGTLLTDTEVNGRAFTIVGLKPLSYYTFRVAAINNEGIGPFTSVHSATTDRNEGILK